ncbi:polymorphic toxin-type HINT domain-containing protein [Gemmata sp. SH-PL17]|uniref:polymorphic toxin-type HINT domain-containing protein n=1 Tax=Gemmata sp. SH-PL17 TaxID=1630693 RepID=UPI0012FBCBE5|nr:polymorphic toxin-type HINT domain-containing protein [Gemmata sp. SH-PL17]
MTGDYTLGATGADTYTLTESGVTGSGSFGATVTGADNYTTSEAGNEARQVLSRTTSGGGSYTRTVTGPGSALPSGPGTNGYTLTELGDERAGHFEQTKAGTNRYDLLPLFADVSNASPGTTGGHLTFYTHGLPFRDPNAVTRWINDNSDWLIGGYGAWLGQEIGRGWALDKKAAAIKGKEGPSLFGSMFKDAKMFFREAGEGLGDGFIIVGNELFKLSPGYDMKTGKIGRSSPLQAKADKIIAQNGGLYQTSALFGRIGANALELAIGGKILKGLNWLKGGASAAGLTFRQTAALTTLFAGRTLSDYGAWSQQYSGNALAASADTAAVLRLTGGTLQVAGGALLIGPQRIYSALSWGLKTGAGGIVVAAGGYGLQTYAEWSQANPDSALALNPDIAIPLEWVGRGVKMLGVGRTLTQPMAWLTRTVGATTVLGVGGYLLAEHINENVVTGWNNRSTVQNIRLVGNELAEFVGGLGGGLTPSAKSVFAQMLKPGAQYGGLARRLGFEWVGKNVGSTIDAVAAYPFRLAGRGVSLGLDGVAAVLERGAETRGVQALNRRVSQFIHGQLPEGSAVHAWAESIAERLGLRACFAPGTPLRTPGGWRNIEDIRPGEWVLSRDEHNCEGPVEPKLVEEVFVREGLLWLLRVNGQTIRTTAEHPFFVAARGWIECHELKVGDQVLTESGAWVTVQWVEDTGVWSTVHNLRVADYHTYFVGKEEWGFSVWSHNSCDDLRSALSDANLPKEVKTAIRKQLVQDLGDVGSQPTVGDAYVLLRQRLIQHGVPADHPTLFNLVDAGLRGMVNKQGGSRTGWSWHDYADATFAPRAERMYQEWLAGPQQVSEFLAARGETTIPTPAEFLQMMSIRREHILHGEVHIIRLSSGSPAPNGFYAVPGAPSGTFYRATGFHHTEAGGAMMTRRSGPNAEGITEATAMMPGPDGYLYGKTNNVGVAGLPPGLSTFFPSSWSQGRVLAEIYFAYIGSFRTSSGYNSLGLPNWSPSKWQGFTTNGAIIEGIYSAANSSPGHGLPPILHTWFRTVYPKYTP